MKIAQEFRDDHASNRLHMTPGTSFDRMAELSKEICMLINMALLHVKLAPDDANCRHTHFAKPNFQGFVLKFKAFSKS